MLTQKMPKMPKIHTGFSVSVIKDINIDKAYLYIKRIANLSAIIVVHMKILKIL
jgi:hypothetical protein